MNKNNQSSTEKKFIKNNEKGKEEENTENNSNIHKTKNKNKKKFIKDNNTSDNNLNDQYIEKKKMSQNFDHIEPISINNNDISDDNLLKDMVRNLNGKKNITNQNLNKI